MALADSYDNIIVGGCTSGLVVASRPTEDPNVTVLVLEAGSVLHELILVLYGGLTSSQLQHGLNERTVAHPRGRTLGGSTAIHVGLMTYPSKVGVDSWEKLGNKGWNFEAMKPYYRKFHTYSPPSKQIHDLLALDYMDDIGTANHHQQLPSNRNVRDDAH